MTVNLIYNRISHHAARSGYDQLGRYLADRLPIRTLEDYLSNVISSMAWWKIAERTGPWVTRRSGSTWYDSYALSLEAKAAIGLIRSDGDIYHHLYGENTYRYLGGLKPFWRGKRNKIVCTYHQPPRILEEVVRRKDIIDRLDAAIVVASNQASYVARFISRERLFVVPLGVDTGFFTPSVREPSDGTQCLFVGQWLRDFEMLRAVVLEVGRQDPQVRFKIITSPGLTDQFDDLSNVEALSGVDDETLMAVYRSADVLLMPLVDCTANCALLEAMSCGLPVIATDVGGIRDYVDSECAVLVQPGDVTGMSHAVLELRSNPALRSEMSNASRRRALAFDWRLIADQMLTVYSQVMN